MKKVLLASTALVAFAGVAAAQTTLTGGGGPGTITITGNAEIGVIGATSTIDHSEAGQDDSEIDQKAQFWNSIDMDIGYAGQTDGGLTFGADFDIDEADNLGNNTDDMGITVFISGDFGTITMGDTDGAIDRVVTDMGDIGNPGSINDAETVHIGYQGGFLDGQGDGQVVRYDYTFDAFQVAVSVEQHDDCIGGGDIVSADGPGAPDDCDDDEVTWGIGFGYEFEFAGGSVDLGLGYQDASNVDSVFIISNDVDDTGSINDVAGAEANTDAAQASLLDDGETEVGSAQMIGVGAVVNLDNGFSAGFTYTDTSFENVDDNLTHIGVGVGYSFDAFSVHFNYGQYEIEDFTLTGFGLAAGYDLGGGASVVFGYGSSETDDFDFLLDGDEDADEFNSSVYSLGLAFSF
ncbi:MAG: porin [Pseudomonadota bacterium]